MSSIIKVENLTKTYKTYHRGDGTKEVIKSFFHREKVLIDAVWDVSFEIEEGTVAGILGPNGAGKSTTIKMLTGALYPTSGSIDVMGFVPSRERQRYVNHMGAVFGQKSQLIWDIPPIDSFAMNQAIYDIPTVDYKRRLKELSELFEVEEIMTKPTRVLSLGERMKCEFIMAMLHEPSIVFLDEPTIGLDVIAKQKIRSFIGEMNRKGTTFILTTHDLDDVEQLADKVVVINHGQKVFDDSLLHLQKSLGEKKIIEMTIEGEYTEVTCAGIETVEKKSDCEYLFALDTKKTTIEDFMAEFSKRNHFVDLSVHALPMETIITKIYEEM